MNFTDFIIACDENDFVSLTNFIILSDKEILCEYCKDPYESDSLKLFFSMTKSFTSLAIGIAHDMQLLSLDDYIIEHCTDELPDVPHPNLKKIRIRHLLTMSCGIHDNTYSDLFVQENWIKAFLAQEFIHSPGTYYRYSTHGSHMLSAIIYKATGLSLEEFLNTFLFYPMDIFEAQWELSPEKLTAGGMGLSLYPHSLVKIAQMLLNNGKYRGKQIISESYLKQATSKQIIKRDKDDGDVKEYGGCGYGFQFHIGKKGYFRMDGAFGQVCLVCPDMNRAFIAFSHYSKTEYLLSLIYKFFIFNDIAIDTKNFILQIKNYYFPDDINIPTGKYRISDNVLGISHLEVSLKKGYIKMININGRDDIIKFNFNKIVKGMVFFNKDLQEHSQKYACKVVKADDGLLELCVYYIETPYVANYTFSFEGDKLLFNFSVFPSMTLHDFSVEGKRI